MTQDAAEIVEQYLSEDPNRWAKLASDIQWRRLQLLLLREILIELRRLTARLDGDLASGRSSDTPGKEGGTGRQEGPP